MQKADALFEWCKKRWGLDHSSYLMAIRAVSLCLFGTQKDLRCGGRHWRAVIRELREKEILKSNIILNI